MRTTAVLSAVRHAFASRGAPAPGRVVAALSGGADSVALLDALVTVAGERGFRVVAAHLDHRMRAGSREDARFCADLCARLGVRLRDGVADVVGRAARDGQGLEAAARRERRAFLRRVRLEEGADVVALAHTLDDQAETVLLRLLRGSGRAGLGGMRARAGIFVRPLLPVTRADVLEHLGARGLPWREDPTNADTAILRNRVRHELLPYLEARFNPRLRRTLADTAAVLRDEDAWLSSLVRSAGMAATAEPGTVTVSRAALASAPRPLARRAIRQALAGAGGLRDVRRGHVERLLDVALGAASGKALPLPGGREARVEFGELRLGRRRHAPQPYAMRLPVPGRVALPRGGAVSAAADPGPPGGDGQEAVVPLPPQPLEVRTRRPGDRVRWGRRGKSLKRFLIERRVPASRRAEVPLVAAGPEVIWVAGVRPPGVAWEQGGACVRLSLEEAAPALERARDTE